MEGKQREKRGGVTPVGALTIQSQETASPRWPQWAARLGVG